MANHKDEAYSAFLKELGRVTVDESQSNDAIALAIASLSYDLPEYDLENVEKLSKSLLGAKGWPDFPTISPKLVENVVTIANSRCKEGAKAEKGAEDFSNISYHLLVVLVQLAVDVLKNGGKFCQAGVASVLKSAGTWQVKAVLDHVVLDGVDVVESNGKDAMQHVVAAEEDDDDFVFEGMDDPPLDSIRSAAAQLDGVADAFDPEAGASAYVSYCATEIAEKHVAFPTSLWFSPAGLDGIVRLIRDLCELSSDSRYGALKTTGWLYLSGLLRAIQSYPGECVDIIAAVGRILSMKCLPLETSMVSLVSEFALLPLVDMAGTCRREVLRLYSEHLNSVVAQQLAVMLRDARKDGGSMPVERLVSLCSCVELAVLWGSGPVVAQVLSSGVWRDLCCLASLTRCEWVHVARQVVLSGCVRHENLFAFTFRVPSLVAALPVPQAGSAMSGVDNFLWILLQSQCQTTAENKRKSLQSYLLAAIVQLSQSLHPSDDTFAEWCLLSQLLDALTNVQQSLRRFLHPRLEEMKEHIWPMIVGTTLNVPPEAAKSEQPDSVPQEDGIDSTENLASASLDEAGDEVQKERKPKWHQCKHSVMTKLKRLLEQHSSKCD